MEHYLERGNMRPNIAKAFHLEPCTACQKMHKRSETWPYVVVENNSLEKVGRVLYYCSEACRDGKARN